MCERMQHRCTCTNLIQVTAAIRGCSVLPMVPSVPAVGHAVGHRCFCDVFHVVQQNSHAHVSCNQPLVDVLEGPRKQEWSDGVTLETLSLGGRRGACKAHVWYSKNEPEGRVVYPSA